MPDAHSIEFDAVEDIGHRYAVHMADFRQGLDIRKIASVQPVADLLFGFSDSTGEINVMPFYSGKRTEAVSYAILRGHLAAPST